MTHSYRLIPLIIAGIVLTGLISAIAEEVTLTTYYPAPTGEYNELETESLTLTPGDGPPVAANSELEGMFYYDDGTGGNTEGLYYCEEDGEGWTLLGGGVWIPAANGTDIYYDGGNVGIRTTTPFTALTKGSGGLEIAAVAGQPELQLHRASAGVSGVQATANLRVNDNKDFVINVRDFISSIDTDAMVITSDKGYVGIGTSDPQKQLHIYDPGTISGRGLVIDSPMPTLVLKERDEDEDEKYWKYIVASGILYGYATNDAEDSSKPWLIVERTDTDINKVAFPNGNVGIGTTHPTGILDVSSSTSGFIPPRMGDPSSEITSPVEGMIAYDNDGTDGSSKGLKIYSGSAWLPLGGALGSPSWESSWFDVSSNDTGTVSGSPPTVEYSHFQILMKEKDKDDIIIYEGMSTPVVYSGTPQFYGLTFYIDDSAGELKYVAGAHATGCRADANGVEDHDWTDFTISNATVKIKIWI